MQRSPRARGISAQKPLPSFSDLLGVTDSPEIEYPSQDQAGNQIEGPQPPNITSKMNLNTDHNPDNGIDNFPQNVLCENSALEGYSAPYKLNTPQFTTPTQYLTTILSEFTILQCSITWGISANIPKIAFRYYSN